MAFLNGEFVPFSEAKLPVFDLGVMQGASVVERLRTVAHRPYLLQEHLDRLANSLDKAGWRLPAGLVGLDDVVAQTVAQNVRLIPSGDDLSIVLFVTAGQALGDANGLVSASEPTVCVYTAPLPLARWKPFAERGLRLAIPETRQLPSDVIDANIKMRSRMHWHMADQGVQQSRSGDAALLLDHRGFVTETSTGNLFVVRKGLLATPSEETTLQGISQRHVIELAAARGWRTERADLAPEDVANADEAFMTSSTYCLLPVTELNGRRIGARLPGAVTKMLMEAWSAEMGFDFIRQMLERGSTTGD